MMSMYNFNVPHKRKQVPRYSVCLCETSNKHRKCWCTCMHVAELEHLNAFLFPGERLHSVTAAHTRWLSKEGQVVVPMQHTQACMQRMLTFASVDCCRDRKNLLFHMLVLVTTLPYTLYFPTLPSSVRLPPPSLQSQPDGSLNIVYLGWRSQM